MQKGQKDFFKSKNAKRLLKSKKLFKKMKKTFLKQKGFKISYGWSVQKTSEAQLRPVCLKNFWSQICGTEIHTHRIHRYIVVRYIFSVDYTVQTLKFEFESLDNY